MTEFITGLGYAWSGFRLITRPGVRRYVIIPLLINTLLFAGAIVYITGEFSQLLQQLVAQWSWLEWMVWIIWPLFMLVMLALLFFCFSLLANLLAGPFNGWLAAAMERNLGGAKQPDAPPVSLMAEIAGAVVSELKKLGFFLSARCRWACCFSYP
jgi:CysZ protein